MKINTIDHENNARYDSKCIQLIKKHSYNGYGLFWGIVEYMHSQNGYIPNIPEDIAEVLPYYSGDIKPIIDTCLDIGLFKLTTDNLLYSKRCLKELEKQNNYIQDKSRAGKQSASNRIAKKNNANNNKFNDVINSVGNNVPNTVNNDDPNSIYLSNNLSVLSNTSKEENNIKETLHELQTLIIDEYPNIAKIKTQLTDIEARKLEEQFSREQIINIFDSMENTVNIFKKYETVYRTALKWLKNNQYPKYPQNNYKAKPKVETQEWQTGDYL